MGLTNYGVVTVTDEQRKIPNGRRKDDGFCLLHEGTCNEIDHLRGLFKWAFGLAVTVAIALGGVGIVSIDKMHDTLTTLESDVRIIKYRIERDYATDKHSEIDSNTEAPG
jgi:hypothetical protein